MATSDCMRDQFKEGLMLDNGRYVTMSPLNNGSFGCVSLARDLETGENVAIKCLNKPELGINQEEFNVNDIEELKYHNLLGSHPHIVNLLHSFETKHHIFIVLEYCAMGDLYETIRFNKGPMELEHVREFMLQLISAVEHMHTKGVYHRDIKPENIFLTADGTMKLGDFGLATTEKMSNEASVGSDRYMAPEQYDVKNGAYDPAKADVWALGIVLLNVLFSRNPFSAPDDSDPLLQDFRGDRQTLFDIFPTMSMDTFDILNNSLQIDPAMRSLEGMRKAIERLSSWTTDDEIFDDEFLAEALLPTILGREPVPTPSANNSTSFPWAKELEKSTQQQSQVYERENVPFSERSVNIDNSFVQGSLDSGLGASLDSLSPRNASPFKSVSFFSNSRIEIIPPRAINTKSEITVNVTSVTSPMSPIFISNASVAQIPIAAPKKPATVNMKQDSGISTSWSDIFEEELEEQENERQRIQEGNNRTWSYGSEKNVKVNTYAINTNTINNKKSTVRGRFFGDEDDMFYIDDEEEPDWVTHGFEPEPILLF